MSAVCKLAGLGLCVWLAATVAGCSPSHDVAPKAEVQRPSRQVPIAVIRAARISADGVMRTVFTNKSGRTLYWFTFDRPNRVACTTGCTLAWHPVLTRGDAIDLPTGLLLGSFGVIKDPNGRQVTYEGHPLYTSDQDTGPDQANGQGFEDAWYVATINLSPSSW